MKVTEDDLPFSRNAGDARPAMKNVPVDNIGCFPYQETTMRRCFSLFLILWFWLGPLAAILPASSESRLPACCRRHGAHHCAMSDEMDSMPAQALPGPAATVTAPAHCPNFPGTIAASTTRIHALAGVSPTMLGLLQESHSPADNRTAARMSQIRTRAGRAPPSSPLG
jgi:hypothetical protein